jgi:hypothetical protein
VVRRSTDRPEIAQKFVSLRVDSGDLERIVGEDISSVTRCMKGEERALLFCNSRDECDRMASLFGWMPYHSSISADERSESMKLWKDGTTLGLVSMSVLNYCFDYPNVAYVFHLGPPTDAVDYYQAIDRLAQAGGVGASNVYFDPSLLRKPKDSSIDRFGKLVIYDVMHDTSLCRRLRLGFFLDGVGVPCAMLAGAELCDICAAQSSTTRPNSGLQRIPGDLVITSLPVDVMQPSAPLRLLPDPIAQPAPTASFSHHLAAANACLTFGKSKPTSEEEFGLYVRIACDRLAKSCVNCWCHGLEYHSHTLSECRLMAIGGGLQKWTGSLRFPAGVCFYCGCPQKVCLILYSLNWKLFMVFTDDLFGGLESETSSA